MNALNHSQLKKIVKSALKEDLGKLGDITSKNVLLKKDKAIFHFVSREKGILCGIDVSKKVYEIINDKIKFTKLKKDGETIHKKEILAKIEGPAIDLLAGERTALNFLTHLSGISTSTSKMVKLISKTESKILCTRKTTPNLRFLEKYAILKGGGYNHRFGLYDAILIKDNHLQAAGGVKAAIESSGKHNRKNLPIELEVDTLDQLREGLEMDVDGFLLDNMNPEMVKKAITIIRNHPNGETIFVEASGGINYNTLESYAWTGIDGVSMSAITAQVTAVDIKLEFMK